MAPASAFFLDRCQFRLHDRVGRRDRLTRIPRGSLGALCYPGAVADADLAALLPAPAIGRIRRNRPTSLLTGSIQHPEAAGAIDEATPGATTKPISNRY